MKLSASVPEWLPSRPLLVGYLAINNLLGSAIEQKAQTSPAEGWEILLNHIAQREAEQDPRLVPESVRELIERLATKARLSTDGLGALDVATIQDTFRTVVGFPPDDAASTFLMRLPGLGVTSQEDSTRKFIDSDLADAAKAGDVYRFISDPYNFQLEEFRSANSACGELTRSILANRATQEELSSGKLVNALRVASSEADMPNIAIDILGALVQIEGKSVNDPITIKEAFSESFLFSASGTTFTNLRIQDSVFAQLEFAPKMDGNNIPIFQNCTIGELIGPLAPNVRNSKFLDCDIESASTVNATTDQILASDVTIGERVLLTILRKLFFQSGSGRQEGAFYRGLDTKAQQVVPEILSLIHRHGLAQPARHQGKDVWLPNRKHSDIARRLILSPGSSKDAIAVGARNLGSR